MHGCIAFFKNNKPVNTSPMRRLLVPALPIKSFLASLLDATKIRRQRPLGLATRPRTKKPRLKNQSQALMATAKNAPPIPDSEDYSSSDSE